MPALPKECLVVVADGQKALFLVNQGDEVFPNLGVKHKDARANPPSREQGTDRPGRFRDGPNAHKSAVAETDWHRFEKERFAADLADQLYRAAHAREFGTLVLVAPPQTLGMLREELHNEVKKRLLAEVQEFEDARVTTIDGLRVDFPDGWGLVRASNTQPCLVMRFEGNDEAALERIKALFRERIEAASPGIELPV